MTAPEWIAADWGTTHLRVWAMRGDRALARRDSADGMGALAPDQFAPALERAVAGWSAARVVACGMVGSRQGWVEAPYAAVPVKVAPRLIRAPGSRPVWIACGLKQRDPPDVMRGEETQLAGLLAAAPDFDGVVCLPGTHSKWVRISAREACHFQSFMTGEIFDLLARASVLRHSLAEEDEGRGADDATFDAGVEEGLSRPHRAYGALFGLRAAGLVGEADPVAARARLSGLLIGWELAAAKPYWLGQPVVVIGALGLARLYARALRAQGVAATEGDAEAATLAGLAAAWRSLEETE